MSFVNPAKVAVLAKLKDMHYQFHRAVDPREGLQDAVEDYSVKASLGKIFEARDLLVTGPSRIGKTTELRKLIGEFNNSDIIMPDGRPPKIVSVILKGILTWKDLGIYTLRQEIGFPLEKRMTQQGV